ncbi:hypothetical protein TrispH2_003049 [Trichoplax sp. H2]|nr:hypothetical protein TrispH2_003049 [Trichoplax sp. H2]|eukprot:RDD44433.1 hypothetical protein TrispH2_003049 [Trichoplax sp. H2]
MFLTLGFLQSFTCVISLLSCAFLAYFQIQGNVKDFFSCLEVPEWLVYGNIIAPGVLGFLSAGDEAFVATLLMTSIFSCLRSRNNEKVYEIINWTCNTLSLIVCAATMAAGVYITVLYLNKYDATSHKSSCDAFVFVPYIIIQVTSMCSGIFGLVHCLTLCGTCSFFESDYEDDKL